MKDELLKIIIQELRSPISAIMGFTEILKEADCAKDNNLILDTISSASKKTKELLDLALLVTEIDLKSNNDQVRPYKLSYLIDIVISDLISDIRTKKLKVLTPDHSELTEIIINPDMIKQVLKMFLYMAIKQSPDYSSIQILIHENVDHIELEIKHICVVEERSDIETVKQYLKSANPRKWQWPGIEIAVSKYILDLHHGNIEIFNYPDGEVSAKLVFPVNSAKGEALHQLLSQMN